MVRKPYRPMESVILPDGVKEKLLADAEEFLVSLKCFIVSVVYPAHVNGDLGKRRVVSGCGRSMASRVPPLWRAGLGQEFDYPCTC